MKLKSLKPESLSQLLLLLVLPIVLVTCIQVYKNKIQEEIELAVAEHVELLVEPLWNFDFELVHNFLEIFNARHEYQDIKLIGPEGVLLAESQSAHFMSIEQLLIKLNLITVHTVSADIKKEKELLGKIDVSWRDKSIYVTANAILVTFLIYVITFLYSSVAKTNRRLNEKVDALRLALEEVHIQKNYIESIFNVAPEGLVTFNNDKQAVTWNHSFENLVNAWADRLKLETAEVHEHFINHLLKNLQEKDAGEYSVQFGDECINISYASSEVQGQEKIERLVSLSDVTEISLLQQRLSHSEKLESVGRLAAGIAHEINTPTQYVVSNIDFLNEAFEDLSKALKQITRKTDENGGVDPKDTAYIIKASLEEADWEYLQKEIPDALSQTTEGLSRIQSIVAAMKQFAHPSGEVAEPCNLNLAIQTTVTVATNEWKYCADVELKLDEDLPKVPCFLDQLNQVILNIIVNAAHAITERLKITDDSRGKITISTRKTDNFVECCIRDNGVGMTDEVKQRIFDPFFTTKEVNKGSGQGLAIANDIIVTKHKGQIEVESKVMEGTQFTIRLPLEANQTDA